MEEGEHTVVISAEDGKEHRKHRLIPLFIREPKGEFIGLCNGQH